ncbi:MAG: relaxase/mobilization nuclease domain-containing protein [Lacipirellulaceae bacterium]
MIAKLVYGENGYGRSFKGAVRYVASTPDGSSVADRIDFVAVRNLPSENPEAAWRLMAGHARRRKELMRKAGLALRGDGGGEVVHLVLSWAESEREGLTREEMLRAAEGALKRLNLDGNQCFLAAHSDTEENPHLHVIASRVDLETGRLVSAWRSHKALSRWALDYERGRGEVLVKQRERAWRARDEGLIPAKAKPSTSKDQHELEKAAKRLYDARRRVALVRRVTVDQRRRAELRASGKTLRVHYLAAKQAAVDRLALARKAELQRERHALQAERLAVHYRHRTLSLEERAKDLKREATRRVERAVANRHERLDREHAVELGRFYENERSRLGRIYNTLAYTNWGELFAQRRKTGEKGPSILSRAFTAFSDVGHRRATLLMRHETRVAELYAQGKRVLARREERIDQRLRVRLRLTLVKYGRSLGLFDRLQGASRTRLKAEWASCNEARRAVTASAKAAQEQVRELKRVASPAEDAKQVFGKRRSKKSASGDGGCAKPNKPRGPRR